MLTANEYQHAALETAIYPGKGGCIGAIYVALKLAGEAGEFSEKVGKALRDDGFLCEDAGNGDAKWFTPSRREELIKEAGDVAWYLAAVCFELGVSLEDVMLINLSKLADRKARGVLQGSGDNR